MISSATSSDIGVPGSPSSMQGSSVLQLLSAHLGLHGLGPTMPMLSAKR